MPLDEPRRRARAGRGAQHRATACAPAPSPASRARRCAARSWRAVREDDVALDGHDGRPRPRGGRAARGPRCGAPSGRSPPRARAVAASTSHAPGGGETSRVTSASGVSPSGLSMSRPSRRTTPRSWSGGPAPDVDVHAGVVDRAEPPEGGDGASGALDERLAERPRGRRATSASSASRKQTRAPTARASPSLRATRRPAARLAADDLDARIGPRESTRRSTPSRPCSRRRRPRTGRPMARRGPSAALRRSWPLRRGPR